jgi:hypothetical protein
VVMKPFVRPFAAPRPQGALVSPAVAPHASAAASGPPPASASAASTVASPSLPPASATESPQSQSPQIPRPAASLSAVRRPLHPLLPIAAASAAVVKQKEGASGRHSHHQITSHHATLIFLIGFRSN